MDPHTARVLVSSEPGAEMKGDDVGASDDGSREPPLHNLALASSDPFKPDIRTHDS